MMTAMETKMQLLNDIDTIILAVFATIPQEDCIGRIQDAGIIINQFETVLFHNWFCINHNIVTFFTL